MTKIIYTLFLIIGMLPITVSGMEWMEKDSSSWQIGAGIGIDVSQLLQIHPKIGAGQNNLNLSGAFNFYGKYRKGRSSWDNAASWQFGVQKVGAGPIPTGGEIPFQKTIDELRLNSKWGYATKGKSKFFYAADLAFISLITPSYPGNKDYPGVLLRNINDTLTLSRFFAPATINVSPGIDYKPSDKLSLYYSPVAYKGILVMDEHIAALNVHGNEPGKKTFHLLGSLLRVVYQDKYAGGKIRYSSNLALYSNYLKEPQNIDLDWQNQLEFLLVKNLTVNLIVNAFYDHDIQVQITDFSAPGGVSGTGRRVSITEQFLLKYQLHF